MIAGTVRDEIELIVPLELFDAVGKRQKIEFVLDSGFTGFLSLSPALVRQLGLNSRGIQEGRLADGTVSYFRLVTVNVIWDGTPRTIEAQILGEPLIGTRMLKGCELRAKLELNGDVAISELPPKTQ